MIWQDTLSSFFTPEDVITGTAFSRTTPTIDGNVLYVGLQNDGWLLAISRNKGNLLWKTRLDKHPAASITQSPAGYNGVLFVGMSSQEEGFAADPNYPCCSFRGSLSAVDEKTGQVLWKTYTTPENGGLTNGYSGNAVWGSTPVVDTSRGLVYITTGNNYTVPADVANGTVPLASGDYVDSILALDLKTGNIVWAQPHLGLSSDTWTVPCLYSQPGTANCPDPAGPDYDFGQGVMEVSRTAPKRPPGPDRSRDLLRILPAERVPSARPDSDESDPPDDQCAPGQHQHAVQASQLAVQEQHQHGQHGQDHGRELAAQGVRGHGHWRHQGSGPQHQRDVGDVRAHGIADRQAGPVLPGRNR